ncbi:tRNA lysidine(34) synthetase TilS [Phenylobacterium sp.]|uniref:tRNA lysidine(34) synthetase TilS n=1 Tax=Phenylobacterium sp. TaxID=1871053 RepID=UPI0039193040
MDRRLRPDARRPVAVAFSGGGDSLALLLIAQVWANRAGRPLVALTVDHRLNPKSGDWTAACEATARRLGVGFEALAWDGEKPKAGLPAAARAARHRLLADAARAHGARVILMGHTADDALEARLMREAGSSAPEPCEWAPSPAWPQGRGLFLLRPLLSQRRAAIRAWLGRRGLAWIDDPANLDPRFARVRARATAGGIAEAPAPRQAARLALAGKIEEMAGALRLPMADFRAAEPAEAERVLAIACVCAGGGARPPAAERVRRLARRLRAGDPFAATLAGARVQLVDDDLLICREPGEAARGGLRELDLPAGQAMVWDGRFQLKASEPGLQVRKLAGLARRLPPKEARRLAGLPAAVRGALPVVLTADGAVSCPQLGKTDGVKAKTLVRKRLRAAAGLIDREPD